MNVCAGYCSLDLTSNLPLWSVLAPEPHSVFLFQYSSVLVYLNDARTKIRSSLLNFAIRHPLKFAELFRQRVVWARPKTFVIG